MTGPLRNRLRVSLLAALMAAAILPASASAGITNSITVNTTDDNTPNGTECDGAAGDCSLRQAIDLANNNSGDDTIDFDLPDHSTISLTNGPLLVGSGSSDVTDIEGPGADQLTIERADTAGPSEVIDFGTLPFSARASSRRTPVVPPGFNTLANVTIAGGNSFPEQAAGINAALPLLLYGVVVKDNTANAFDSTGAVGGVLNAGTTLVVDNSTISNNSVLDSSGGSGGGLGSFGDMFVINSTVAGNQVTGVDSTGSGGGVWAPQSGTTQLVNATVSSNSANGLGGGGGVFNSAALDLANSIVAQNTSDSSPDCENTGDAVSQNYNVIGIGDACGLTPATGDQIGTAASPLDALLGPLALTDGPTPTMSLLQGSPAIDHGNPDTPSDTGAPPPDPVPCPTTDQRGVERPQRDACDVGAFETRAPLAATTGDGVGLGSTTGGVSGSVTPGVLDADVHFEYGTSPAYGTSTAVQHVAAGDSAVAKVANLAGLSPNTTYHFRIVAENVDGTTAGSDRTFKTAAAGVPDPPPQFGLLDVKDVTIDKDGNVIIPGLFVGCPQAGGPCDVTALIQTLGKVSGKVVAAKHKKKARRHVLGTRTYGVPQGTITKVKVHLSKGTLRLLKKHGKLKVTVHIVITTLGSHKQTKIDKKFVIHGRKGKKKKRAHAASSRSRTGELRRTGALEFFAAHRHSAPANVRWPVRAFR